MRRPELNPPNVNYRHAHALLRQLAACGARRVVISPGSRSTPLALTAISLPEFTTYTLIDERSAAFFALGLAKADGVPAILICTSGTAAANYFPAVIEATQWGTPLLLLTADRPLNLRACGAPQTINQERLYGSYPRFFADLPPAQDCAEHYRLVRSLAAQAYAAALGNPPGPAHLNVPLDEPLAPVMDDCGATFKDPESAEPAAAVKVTELPVAAIDAVAGRIDAALCGLIVLGPQAARTAAETAAIFGLAKALGWPVLADVLSGLRFHAPPVLPYYDIFLRAEQFAQLAPDVVLAFGGYPTSKALNSYLNRQRAAHTVHVKSCALPQDPDRRATESIVADVPALCRRICERVTAARDSLLFAPFNDASSRVRAALSGALEDATGEAAAVIRAVAAVPDGGRLALAGSMAVRYAETLAAANGRLPHVYGLRGANGIDGTLSHAAGIAAASAMPTLLVTGDLAFVHDLNGLMAAARFAPQLTLLLLNNNGGGIFHFLPIADQETAEQFERIHGTPHHLKLAAAAELFGLDWTTLHSPEQIDARVPSPHARPCVLELRSERAADTANYQRLIAKLTEAAGA